ncbi:WD40 repeat-like protein [Lojkania enalia]|uniref:WD40 repeat-like protein n=1 Tax=Lojkania enalia TaxID=147567 RepID=A0A9P4N122_9PLEO|nr:WD40 repeat-like protein [Didymosphaeria enalia]
MHLLRRSNTGEFSLTEDLVGDGTIPPYSILSHRWGLETEEVTFEDMISGTYKNKPGYKKIQFCGEQARRDNLQYFWIDTCCINKSNHGEHQKAINSMFRWYQNAVKCYVYLSDIVTIELEKSNNTNKHHWELAFQESEWFTRGWTLQELIAPSSVEFFSHEGKQLGNKKTLERQIHQITGIPILALQGEPLNQFSDNERFSWIERRQTKLTEDKAYSLLGIFDVYIPIRYGEGMASAFKRLEDEIDTVKKCIQDLWLTDPRDDKKRIEDTKGGLIDGSYLWILKNSAFQRWRNDQHSQLLWIKGDPGKGKTMLLCGIVNELKKSIDKTDLLSYFFCQATDSRINNAIGVLRGLLYLLVIQQPSLVSHIRNKYDHAGKSLFEDANSWVALSEIFTSMIEGLRLNKIYLIIDALDECVADLPKLLGCIIQTSAASSRVKWIVSSRNWPDIEECLERARHKVRLSLELNAQSVSEAVSVFIQHKVRQLEEQKRYNDKIRNAVLDYLSLNAHGTFLWVALVCQNLESIPKRNVMKKLDSFPPGLNALYERMVQQINNLDEAGLCKQILALAVVVYQPIMLEELVTLTEQLGDLADDLESIQEIIGYCGSFLTLRENTIYFVHQSAKEFLLAHASLNVFPSEEEDTHGIIFSRSLQAMPRLLHRDMYRLGKLGYPTENIKRPEPDPLAALRYSCIYWIDHLYDSCLSSPANNRISLQDGGTVHSFLRTKYLYWLEALSLCQSMSKGIVSMTKLAGLVQGRIDAPLLNELIQDARRFIMNHKQAIGISPLQVYTSALLFSPARSLIKGLFKEEGLKGITTVPPIRDSWSACIQTLEGHSDNVTSVAFSHDSTRVASASYDETIKIWDASSGECLQTLTGHSNNVNSVAFSHDSTRVASASWDKTVKIWDASSGECLQTLECHSHYVNSVAFSHDSTRVASASYDKTVKICDMSNGECLRTLKGHSNIVNSVAFSHDSTRVASASYDRTVKIWDASSGECLQTLEGHSFNSVTFSHDSTRVASASWDETIKILDASSGECLQTLEGHSDYVYSVAFSQDSTQVASASYDGTIKIWDASSGECLQTFAGHSNNVNSVAFSHDSTRVASASWDKTVKIWDASSDECLQTLECHSRYVNSVAFSYDSTQMASASCDETVKIWDTSSCECLQTLKGHSRNVNSVAFSYDSTRVASASWDETVKIWDASSGECLRTFEGHRDYVNSVAFSYDSTRTVSASLDETVKIWDASSGECLQTLTGHSDNVNSVAFSHDSTRLASASLDETIKIWDANSGECLQTLEGHSDNVNAVAFSQDSTWLASASWDETVKIWDASSGECLQTFSIGKSLTRISFNLTGSYLLTEIGTINISALSDSRLLPPASKPQNPQYQGLALSADGVWITNNSENLVWLPSEYRPSCSAVLGKTIGIGVGSGRVWLCKAAF